jgi:NTE family protein
MPFGTEGKEPGIGVALSGGGFRATLFHLGALWRLNELGLLDRIERFSSISGGSITAGLLAKEWARLEFQNGVATGFAKRIVEPLRQFCRRRVDTLAIGEGLLTPWKTVSAAVQERFEEQLFHGFSLRQLPDKPRFVFNSTNLQTGKSFRFSKPYIGDYRIGLIYNPDLPLSLAVTASSAFPPVLSPVILDNLPPFEKVDGADLHGDPRYSRNIHLTDGGVYDNLGLETVWNRYDTLLVSDAGAPFKVEDEPRVDWLSQARSALDIATDQARALRKRAVVADFQAGNRHGAYWGIDTRIAHYPISDRATCLPELVEPLAAIRTRLNPFSEQEQGRLVNWGYALCDAALRSYGAGLVPDAKRPDAWPVPGEPLGTWPQSGR